LQKDDHQLANPNAAAENRRAVDAIWKETDKSNMTQMMSS